MDPSLLEIIGSAVSSARGQGLGVEEQRDAAEAVLLAMVPSLTPSIANLVVEQLYPFIGDRDMGGIAAL
ncbi:hypothetical protein [Magnetospirillum sp. SS-4]|uniref:hypothetical protein n=1 Tax=Magnetospirillum sp. SS-4 TaxID=2681465 RepID=UPI00138619B4|nr:hypothetical protein [Magnetospirillum sp. SS-4]CAA7622065.1 conserved hypothetical protein [Magnetospirillum sp. SS-4]